MEFKDPTFAKRFRANEVSPEELKDYLMRNYSVFELADALAEYLIEDRLYMANRIVLTPAQQQMLQVMFKRVSRPLNADKGRKPKNEKTLVKREEGLFE